jgi:hypothetical protein
MYFKNFDKIYYDFQIGDKHQLHIVTDITKNLRFKKEILANITVYDKYDIRDGETPEIIAEKIYGNAKYHWIIMLVNERYDYLNDFPLSTYNLEKHITQKYGAGNEYDTHHYVDLKGFTVDEDNAEATSVSNYQYEDDLNETKRTIKIVSPSLINTILRNFNSL